MAGDDGNPPQGRHAADIRSLCMNTKAEQQPRHEAPPISASWCWRGWCWLAGLVGYTWSRQHRQHRHRCACSRLLAALVVSLAIAAFTALGRRVRHFIGESQFELRKVVWPTRDETIKTTGIIIAVVIVLSLLLGLIDLDPEDSHFDWLLKLGT
jgi:preprotein translocase subunit SecE